MNSTTPTGPLKQRFTVACPRATMITLVGDFTQWHEKPLFLQKGDDDLWAVTADVVPGTYHFRFVVDQEPDTRPDEILQVPGPGGSLQPVHRTL